MFQMIRPCRLFAGAMLIIACMTGYLHAQSPAQIVQIPAAVKTGTTIYGFTDGARMMAVVKEPGDFRFEIPATSKLMMYVPGYAVVAHDFTGREGSAAQPFAPDLVPLAPVRVNAQLVNSSGQPLVGRRVSIAYPFSTTFRFFGMYDGNMPVISLGSATTDSGGNFAFDVLAKAGDPVLQRYGEGSVCLWDASTRGSGCKFDPTLRPSTFLPGSLNGAPIVITRTELGTLSGTLGAEYLAQHRASGEARQQARVMAEPIGPTAASFIVLAQYADVAADGRFSIDLPKGTYNVTFVLLKPNSPMLQVEERAPLESGIAIEEGRRHIIERP